MGVIDLLWCLFHAALIAVTIYAGFLCLLTLPSVQVQVIYLHSVTLTWFQDVNFPVQGGFLPNQVTPFRLRTSDGEHLHAWHILPSGLYEQHAEALASEPAGLALDVTARFSFKLLRDDPQSLLVLYFHGAGGTLGSGWRPPSYRAMHALSPDRIHTVAIDYRGFGTSSGKPSEQGLLIDALTLAEWAMQEAQIPPERIVIFAQSLGTAVAVSLIRHLATQKSEPIYFKGVVLVAPFANVEELTCTYRVAGTVPLLSPLARFPTLYSFFKTFLLCKWPSKDTLVDFVQTVDATSTARYDVSIIHAMDDWDIPWSHSETLFWHVVEATLAKGENYDEVRDQIESKKIALGVRGRKLKHQTRHGVLRQEIVEYGLHDRIMSYPIVSAATWRAFQSAT